MTDSTFIPAHPGTTMYARCNESSGGPVDVASAVVIAWSIEDGIGYPVTAAPFHDAVAASGYTICDLDIYVAFENTSVGIQRVTPAAHALQCANTAAPNDPSAAPQDAHPTPAHPCPYRPGDTCIRTCAGTQMHMHRRPHVRLRSHARAGSCTRAPTRSHVQTFAPPP